MITTFLAVEFEWDVVWRFLFNAQITKGAWVTIQVAVLAQLVGVALGTVFAVMGMSRNPANKLLAGFYVWFFRGTPVLLQLFMLYFGLPQLLNNQTFTTELTAFRAAILAFGVNEGAYMSEIVRAGILSVEAGQMDAAKSLGMTQFQAMRHIVLPQALRVVLPPTGNEFIAMLKNSSLASAISLVELLLAAQTIYAVNFKFMELLVVAAIWYLTFTTVFSLLQAELERLLAVGQRERPQTLFSRALTILGGRRGI
ncbi:MAG TPA: amino acid ABC transporter permease [Dehalococcoidia bacterium]|nr:amino acid ABC transporter permease [Dehalococcoidia bacterium]